MALPENTNYDMPQVDYGEPMKWANKFSPPQESTPQEAPPQEAPPTAPSPMDNLLAQTRAASAHSNRNTAPSAPSSPKSVDLSQFSGLRSSLQEAPKSPTPAPTPAPTSPSPFTMSANSSPQTSAPLEQTSKVLTSLPTNIPWGSGTRKTAVGQCGALVNDLAGLRMGDSIQSKIAVLDPGLSSLNVAVGDVFVQSVQNDPEGHGHTGFINSIGQDERGRYAVVTEANYRLNGLTTHGRKLYLNDPAIKGFAKPKKALSAPAQKAAPTKVAYSTAQDHNGVYHRYSNLTQTFSPTKSPDITTLGDTISRVYNQR